MAVRPQVRRYQHSDEADAIGMLVAKFPPSEREAAYSERLARWRWQYYDNPNNPDDGPLIWVAVVEGGFAGMVATIPVKVKTPKGPLLGLWGVDFIVDPRMRGMGIGKRLVETWPKPGDMAFVMGWSPVSYKITVDYGFRAVWGFTTADILLSRIGYAVAQIRKKQRRRLNELARVFWRSNPRSHGRCTERMSIQRTLPEGAGGLWERVRESYGFCVERDEAYLKWRFESHPTHEYHFVCLGEPGALQALGVCRLTREHPPLGVVADLIVDPARESLVSELIDSTVAFLRSRRAYAARMDLTPALAAPILARYRCSLIKDRGMIIRVNDTDLEAHGLLKPDAWYISRSDSDEDY